MASKPMMSIEKLTGRENWASWSFAVTAYLQHEELYDCILSTPTNEAAQKLDIKAKSKLILLVDPILYVHIHDAQFAKNVWDNLAKAFEDSGLTRKVGLLKELINTNLENSASVEDYVNKIMSAAHKLRNIKFNVDDEWLGTLMLAGLPEVYKPMIMGLESSECEEYSRQVVERVEFIPLLPNPETITITSAKCDYTGVRLIVGGENANQGEFPHMAAIGWATFTASYTFKCGGSLISSKFVLTAGHCTTVGRAPDVSNPEPSIVRLGDQNLDPSVVDGANPVEVPIKQIISHPEYKSPIRYNDVALLELASDVTFSSTIRPACLWSKSDLGGYTKALATGWGVTNPDIPESSNELQKVSLTLFDTAQCDQLLLTSRNRHWNGFRDSQLCAGELGGGKDTCQGDSGAPLQLTSSDNQCIFHIIGVTSFGKKCAKSGTPAVYTRVSSYVDWIERTVWPGE